MPSFALFAFECYVKMANDLLYLGDEKMFLPFRDIAANFRSRHPVSVGPVSAAGMPLRIHDGKRRAAARGGVFPCERLLPLARDLLSLTGRGEVMAK